MLNKVAKLFLVSTSLAPICLTLWFLKISDKWNSDLNFWLNLKNNWSSGIWYLIITITLTIICLFLIKLSKIKLEQMPIDITSVKTADKEIVGFILVYLLPMINETTTKVSSNILIFVSLLFFIIIYFSHSYHFNPIMGFLNYHFFEVTTKDGITYVLITKKNITHCKKVKNIVQLTEYMILEV